MPKKTQENKYITDILKSIFEVLIRGSKEEIVEGEYKEEIVEADLFHIIDPENYGEDKDVSYLLAKPNAIPNFFKIALYRYLDSAKNYWIKEEINSDLLKNLKKPEYYVCEEIKSILGKSKRFDGFRSAVVINIKTYNRLKTEINNDDFWNYFSITEINSKTFELHFDNPKLILEWLENSYLRNATPASKQDQSDNKMNDLYSLVRDELDELNNQPNNDAKLLLELSLDSRMEIDVDKNDLGIKRPPSEIKENPEKKMRSVIDLTGVPETAVSSCDNQKPWPGKEVMYNADHIIDCLKIFERDRNYIVIDCSPSSRTNVEIQGIIETKLQELKKSKKLQGLKGNKLIFLGVDDTLPNSTLSDQINNVLKCVAKQIKSKPNDILQSAIISIFYFRHFATVFLDFTIDAFNNLTIEAGYINTAEGYQTKNSDMENILNKSFETIFRSNKAFKALFQSIVINFKSTITPIQREVECGPLFVAIATHGYPFAGYSEELMPSLQAELEKGKYLPYLAQHSDKLRKEEGEIALGKNIKISSEEAVNTIITTSPTQEPEILDATNTTQPIAEPQTNPTLMQLLDVFNPSVAFQAPMSFDEKNRWIALLTKINTHNSMMWPHVGRAYTFIEIKSCIESAIANDKKYISMFYNTNIAQNFPNTKDKILLCVGITAEIGNTISPTNNLKLQFELFFDALFKKNPKELPKEIRFSFLLPGHFVSAGVIIKRDENNKTITFKILYQDSVKTYSQYGIFVRALFKDILKKYSPAGYQVSVDDNICSKEENMQDVADCGPFTTAFLLHGKIIFGGYGKQKLKENLQGELENGSYFQHLGTRSPQIRFQQALPAVQRLEEPLINELISIFTQSNSTADPVKKYVNPKLVVLNREPVAKVTPKQSPVTKPDNTPLTKTDEKIAQGTSKETWQKTPVGTSSVEIAREQIVQSLLTVQLTQEEQSLLDDKRDTNESSVERDLNQKHVTETTPDIQLTENKQGALLTNTDKEIPMEMLDTFTTETSQKEYEITCLGDECLYEFYLATENGARKLDQSPDNFSDTNQPESPILVNDQVRSNDANNIQSLTNQTPVVKSGQPLISVVRPALPSNQVPIAQSVQPERVLRGFFEQTPSIQQSPPASFEEKLPDDKTLKNLLINCYAKTDDKVLEPFVKAKKHPQYITYDADVGNILETQKKRLVAYIRNAHPKIYNDWVPVSTSPQENTQADNNRVLNSLSHSRGAANITTNTTSLWKPTQVLLPGFNTKEAEKINDAIVALKDYLKARKDKTRSERVIPHIVMKKLDDGLRKQIEDDAGIKIVQNKKKNNQPFEFTIENKSKFDAYVSSVRHNKI